MFSEKDIKEIKKRGLSLDQVNDQIEVFKNGIEFLPITQAATPGNGIRLISESDKEKFIQNFSKACKKDKIIKFVPASGAASRMFKALFEFMQTYTGSQQEYLDLISNNEFHSVYYFFKSIKNFAFYNELRNEIFESKNEDIDNMVEHADYVTILEYLLTEKGLNYGNLPKGLIKFHNYVDYVRTAFEEHLVEAIGHLKSSDGKVKVHFTISKEHQKLFDAEYEKTKRKLEQKYEVEFDVSFSYQDPSTDTIAVDLNNEPFRDEKGKLVFRPGGHGSLIHNLNHLDADIIFIKNIDNITPDRLRDINVEYKKLLAGQLIQCRDKIYKYIIQLNASKKPDREGMLRIERFVEKDLRIVLPEEYQKMHKPEKIEVLLRLLNRPIRVCGMVRNEGEPGGGPFFAKNADGTESLQIVESSQIDLENEEMIEIVKQSTHFNPVDLVCSIKDYQGNKFDLTQYVEAKTAFISEKSKDGKTLKALEWPGLWNGAMANWISIFVEVPIETFNPVKIINDLLREEHQSYQQ